MYAHTHYLSLDIHRETDLFLVVLAFINIFYLSSVIHPDGGDSQWDYYWSCCASWATQQGSVMCACLILKNSYIKKLQLHR